MLTKPRQIPLIPTLPIVIHNDLDGLLSWIFLSQKGYNLAGIYDLETVWLSKGQTFQDVLAVDLDLSVPKIPSIGHHFLLFDHPNHFNMNTLFGVSSAFHRSKSLKPTFFSKCPLPTVLFLHWITGTPLPDDETARAWLVYADGLWQSFKSYPQNVTQWLVALGYDELLSDLSQGRLESHLHRIPDTLTSYGFSPTPRRSYPQCTFPIKNLRTLHPLIEELSKQGFHCEAPAIPSLIPVVQGYRYSLTYDLRTYTELHQKFEQGRLLSHGVVSMRQVEVTMLEPLSQSRDRELIERLVGWKQYSTVA